jgi:hypothetical protein
MWPLSPITFLFFLMETMDFFRKNGNVTGDKDNITILYEEII